MGKINDDQQVLTDFEHVLRYSGMYVGSVDPTEEKIPIIDRGALLVSKNKIYSVGMYKIFDEVLDNVFDEAKRCFVQGTPMKEIQVSIDTAKNEITVKDTGRGFKNAHLKNEKTGLTNVETALTILRAGSNFSNQEIDVDLQGMHGIGVSCTNMLSDEFSVITVNNEKVYAQKWKQFKSTGKKVEDKSTRPGLTTGTVIKFIPRKDIFKGLMWDYDIILTRLIFRNLLMKHQESLKDINLIASFDGNYMDLNVDFFPSNMLEIKNTKHLKIFTWPCFADSTSISFVNGCFSTGIHQRMVNEILNEKVFGYDKAHNFYETCIMLNLPPKHIKFGDQNKTKFTTNRQELEPILKFNITDKEVVWIKQSQWYGEVAASIDETLKKGEINKLKKARKQSAFKISPKFFSATKKENLFLVEGNSARGSILQKRSPDIDAVYTLRGKVQNTKTLEDLSSNKEIIELINILDLNLEDKGDKIKYRKVIIAADSDPDGYHITSLLISFFNKWFPNVIKNGNLFVLTTPLVSMDIGKKREYFYSIDEYSKSKYAGKSGVRYLKGLGSLDIKDWEYIFSNLNLGRITSDDLSDKMLMMAFGDNSSLRKKWLEKVI